MRLFSTQHSGVGVLTGTKELGAFPSLFLACGHNFIRERIVGIYYKTWEGGFSLTPVPRHLTTILTSTVGEWGQALAMPLHSRLWYFQSALCGQRREAVYCGDYN